MKDFHRTRQSKIQIVAMICLCHHNTLQGCETWSPSHSLTVFWEQYGHVNMWT